MFQLVLLLFEKKINVVRLLDPVDIDIDEFSFLRIVCFIDL